MGFGVRQHAVRNQFLMRRAIAHHSDTSPRAVCERPRSNSATLPSRTFNLTRASNVEQNLQNDVDFQQARSSSQ